MAGRLPRMTPQQRRTWTDRIGQFNGSVFKSDQSHPYYILPILFPTRSRSA
jgi:hypothetical protein